MTVDPALLRAVDEYVAEHEERDRSKVVDQAPMGWCTNRRAEGTRCRFAPEPVEVEGERAAWRRSGGRRPGVSGTRAEIRRRPRYETDRGLCRENDPVRGAA